MAEQDDIIKQLQIGSPDWLPPPQVPKPREEVPWDAGLDVMHEPTKIGQAADLVFGGPVVRNIMNTEPVSEAEPFNITTPTQGNVRGAVRDIGQQAIMPLEDVTRMGMGVPPMTDPAERAKLRQFGGKAAEFTTEMGLYGGIGAGIFGAVKSLATIGKTPLPSGAMDDIMGLVGEADATVAPKLQGVLDKMGGKTGPTVGPEVEQAAQAATRKLTQVEKMARFNRGLTQIKNHYKNLFTVGKISPAEMAEVTTQIEELSKLPRHIAKELRPRTMPSKGWAGLFTPKGRYGGAPQVARHTKKPGVIAHEFGHGLLKRLRSDVRDKLLKSPMGSVERQALTRVDGVLSEMRDATQMGRAVVGRYEAHMKSIYRKGLISKEKYDSLYRRYYELYHKIPPDEMIVERFSEMISKGVSSKEALKATTKMAVNVRDKNLELMRIMSENLPKIEKGVATNQAILNMENKVGGAVKELEQTLKHMKTKPGTHRVMAKENMLNDIQKSLMNTPEKYSGQWRAEMGLDQPGGLMKYMDDLQTKSHSEIQKVHKNLGAIMEAEGVAPGGRFKKGALSGEPVWQRSMASHTSSLPTPSRLPQVKGAIGREKLAKGVLNILERKGVPKNVIDDMMQYATPEQLKELLQRFGGK